MKRPARAFPSYVQAVRDRYGQWHTYFRRGGVRVPLPKPLLGREWWEAYRTALADYITGREPGHRSEIGAARVKPGTVAHAFVLYTTSTKFRNELAESTRRWHFNILSHWRDQWGDRRLAHLQRRHVENALEGYADTPAQAAKFLKALRRMLQYCVGVGAIEHDPSQGIKPPKHQETSYRPWTEDELARYRRRHSLGSTARLALELFLGTAQRPSDVVRMGRDDVRGDAIYIKQKKTGWEGYVEFTDEALAAVRLVPPGDKTFITTARGRAFGVDSFRNKFRLWCNQAGLPKDCHAHGLRVTAAVQMAEDGYTPHEIAAITGHSLIEVQRYTRRVDQVRLMRAGRAKTRAARAKTGTEIVKLEAGIYKIGS
jgi:integrase